MKDYSNLIPSSYGFITSYEISGNELCVYTVESKKGEPHKYKATKKKVAEIERRLENQYKLIIENQEVVKKVVCEKALETMWKVIGGGVSLSIATALILSILNSFGGITLLVCGIILSSVIGVTSKIYKEKQFEKEMNIITAYIANRKDIAKTRQKDFNVTEFISKDTQKKINQNKDYVDNEIKSEIFDVWLMDNALNDGKTSDIEKILNRYEICQKLQETQAFVMPENKGKKRILKKKTDNNN